MDFNGLKGRFLQWQDASEYLQFLLEVMSRAERTLSQRVAEAAGHTAGALEFSIETRVQCGESGRVSYKRDAPTNILSLNIPVEAAANLDEVEEYQVTLCHIALCYIMFTFAFARDSAEKDTLMHVTPVW